jgi:flagellar biosynthesis/type III secretory pathway protein FliH
MGEKMLGRELTLRPEDLERLIREGLRQLADTERLRLVVHPQDYDLLQGADRSAWPPGLELAADPTLTPGGFVLETPHGDLDGTWESRWDRLARIIEEALDSAYENQPAP